MSRNCEQLRKELLTLFAAPEGIEPPPKVPETFVLSIKLRSRFAKVTDLW
jgi:hypothetical protein